MSGRYLNPLHLLRDSSWKLYVTANKSESKSDSESACTTSYSIHGIGRYTLES